MKYFFYSFDTKIKILIAISINYTFTITITTFNSIVSSLFKDVLVELQTCGVSVGTFFNFTLNCCIRFLLSPLINSYVEPHDSSQRIHPLVVDEARS